MSQENVEVVVDGEGNPNLCRYCIKPAADTLRELGAVLYLCSRHADRYRATLEGTNPEPAWGLARAP
jgi:hypothetical protein